MKCKVKKIHKYYNGGIAWKDMTTNQKWGAGADAFAGVADLVGTATSGQKATVGTALGGAAKGAMAGAAFGPVGIIGGAIAGTIAGTAGSKNKVNWDSNSLNRDDIAEEGSGWMKWFGMSDDEMQRKVNMVQNANLSKIASENMRNQYYNQPNIPVQPIINAAEGGIMRRPVDALVSKGELIYDPTTKKLRQVPGSKGKPNKADDVYARLYEGDVVISNSPTMLMANGKTPAQNLIGMVDKHATGGTVKAREAIIKKVVNWLEANKTKPQEYAKFSEGEDEVLNVPIKKIKKDFEFANYDPIAEMKKELDQKTFAPIKADITGKDSLKNLTKDQRAVLREAVKIQNGKSKTDWLSGLSDFVPMLSAFAKDYSYSTEPTYINPVLFMPVSVGIDPIRRATDEGMAIARYNQMNANPSTGAGIAHGLQAAVNRSKSLSDAYKWQQDTQNKLIAQNTGIYNDWASREAQARHTAATETAQNKAAARLMRDQAIKDSYEFQTGRRNDRWKLSMLEPLFKYAVDDNIWKNFKIA